MHWWRGCEISDRYRIRVGKSSLRQDSRGERQSRILDVGPFQKNRPVKFCKISHNKSPTRDAGLCAPR